MWRGLPIWATAFFMPTVLFTRAVAWRIVITYPFSNSKIRQKSKISCHADGMLEPYRRRGFRLVQGA
ncbi:MAG: hypothetical protein DYG89_37895 [Caldilinea sp. CFX5]|nr:hypothetical protein [Caldilinea sp. CFX5]